MKFHRLWPHVAVFGLSASERHRSIHHIHYPSSAGYAKCSTRSMLEKIQQNKLMKKKKRVKVHYMCLWSGESHKNTSDMCNSSQNFGHYPKDHQVAFVSRCCQITSKIRGVAAGNQLTTPSQPINWLTFVSIFSEHGKVIDWLTDEMPIASNSYRVCIELLWEVDIVI